MPATLARLFFLAALATPAYAAETPPELGSSLGQIAFGLIVVFALLGGALWLIKRLSGPRSGTAGMQVVGALALGSRERIVLVKVADEVLVLGVNAGGIRTLHTLPAEALHTAENNPAAPVESFCERLAQTLGSRHN